MNVRVGQQELGRKIWLLNEIYLPAHTALTIALPHSQFVPQSTHCAACTRTHFSQSTYFSPSTHSLLTVNLLTAHSQLALCSQSTHLLLVCLSHTYTHTHTFCFFLFLFSLSCLSTVESVKNVLQRYGITVLQVSSNGFIKLDLHFKLF